MGVPLPNVSAAENGQRHMPMRDCVLALCCCTDSRRLVVPEMAKEGNPTPREPVMGGGYSSP
tara:strand:+ start:126 stop:311 length:186 start_codon:yes stop_codon:yes gene_type:complete